MLGYFRRPIGPDDKYEHKVVRGLDRITTDLMAIVCPLVGIFSIIFASLWNLQIGFYSKFFAVLVTCICFGLTFGIIALRNDRPIWGAIGVMLNIASIVIFWAKFLEG